MEDAGNAVGGGGVRDKQEVKKKKERERNGRNKREGYGISTLTRIGREGKCVKLMYSEISSIDSPCTYVRQEGFIGTGVEVWERSLERSRLVS